MSIVSAAGFAVIAAVLAVMLRGSQKEFAVLLTVGACLVLLTFGIQKLLPFLQLLQRAAALGSVSAYARTLMKALGISYCTQFAADICRDAGENALSSKIEFAGKAALIALALPLYSELMLGITAILR